MKRPKSEAIFLFVFFVQIVFDQVMRKVFLPWDPARRWMDLGDAGFFLFYLIFFFVLFLRALQNKRSQGDAQAQEKPAFFLKRPVWYLMISLICIYGAVACFLSFLNYGAF